MPDEAANRAVPTSETQRDEFLAAILSLNCASSSCGFDQALAAGLAFSSWRPKSM
jgi:hypothetical protein